MPWRPMPDCREPGCREPSAGRGRCVGHQAHWDAAHPRKRGTTVRPTPAQRGYDARWQARRDVCLTASPYCAQCGARATDVHHLKPRRDGGGDTLDNLVSLCHSCHSAITARGG